MLKHLLAVSTIASLYASTYAQPYPEPGKRMPDFSLHHIEYYPKKTATLKDFRGKWLLLDFWAESCGACIAGFPNKNRIQKELGEKVQVMMVGIHGENLKDMYARYRNKEGLTMPCAFDTSLFYARFDFEPTLPKAILIDDKGIVQSVTTNVDYNDMKAFLAGEHPFLPKAYRQHEAVLADDGPLYKFNNRRPFAIDNNGAADTNFLFRSVLTPWDPALNQGDRIEHGDEAFDNDPRSFWALGIPLQELYFYAYFGMESYDMNDGKNYGEYFRSPVVAGAADSSIFKFSFKNGKNMFSYAVNFPRRKVTKGQLRKVLRNDLENCFGFQATVETRKMPCWNIVATDSARERLKTKGGQPTFSGSFRLGFTYINTTFDDVLPTIRNVHREEYFFDQTGITDNIDLVMQCEGCVLTDLMDLKKALVKNGLDLVRGEKEMKVLVIRENNDK